MVLNEEKKKQEAATHGALAKAAGTSVRRSPHKEDCVPLVYPLSARGFGRRMNLHLLKLVLLFHWPVLR